MTRYVKPEAGGLARFSEKVVESGDGAWYPVLGGITTVLSVPTGIFGAAAVDPLFLGFLLPALFFITTIFGYLSGTVRLGHYSNDVRWYQKARYKHWPRLEGTEYESMAKPLLLQIYNCTLENHPGTSSNRHCSLCIEREKVMSELIPNKPTDRSDIDTVKRYLEMRKEAEIEHAKAMKELMP